LQTLYYSVTEFRHMKTTNIKPTTRLLTVSQAAEQYCVCERIVRRWIADREIPFLRIGRSIRLSPEDLEAFIEKHRIEPIN
jgi:excisionase family DNA binding protein